MGYLFNISELPLVSEIPKEMLSSREKYLKLGREWRVWGILPLRGGLCCELNFDYLPAPENILLYHLSFMPNDQAKGKEGRALSTVACTWMITATLFITIKV